MLRVVVVAVWLTDVVRPRIDLAFCPVRSVLIMLHCRYCGPCPSPMGYGAVITTGF